MFQQTYIRSATLLAALSGLCIYSYTGGYFAKEIVIEIAILAILAISLDLVAGFGGMVSLGHGAIMGVAAYAYSILTVKLGYSPVPAAFIGLGAAMFFGFIIAAVTSNTTGIFFIMATLAFGQMAYTVFFQSYYVGGSDGMSGVPRFDFSSIGIDITSASGFAFFAVAMIALAYTLSAFILRASFGRTLCGIQSNETRMKALGVNVWKHKVLAFTFSSMIAGIAGIVAAQHTQFISPDMLFWTVSGEVLIVVILGGLGTLVGPVIGAIVFISLKHEIGSYTNHWHIIIGIVLIATVLFGGRGLFGQAEHWINRIKAKAGASNA